MIEVEHLTKYYGDSPALRDVTFNVEQGEILGFLGPNGAGKTTTMRIITGYLPPSSGTVRVAGFDVVDKSLEARRHLGYLPETVPLYTDLTTYEYLDFRGRICGLINGRERKTRIYDVMDQLNIGDVSGKLVGQLSRGYRQRVGLAQALLHNPDVLILDEPTVGLDPVQITDVRDLIRELGKNHTIILSTHLLPEVSIVCNRVIIINRGRLVALDTPINLAEDVAESHEVQVEVGGKPSAVLQSIRSVRGVTQASLAVSQDGAAPVGAPESLSSGIYSYQVISQPGTDVRSEVASALVRDGHQLRELRSLRLSLEDIFLRVIAREAETEDLEEQFDEDYAEEGDEYIEEEEYEEEPEPEPVSTVRISRRRARR
jgi:ABC-2 type transport system ATP-binding protein